MFDATAVDERRELPFEQIVVLPDSLVESVRESWRQRAALLGDFNHLTLKEATRHYFIALVRFVVANIPRLLWTFCRSSFF